MNVYTQQGFLILADITGFTPFVAGTELEHSQEILHYILNGIVTCLTPAFTLAEVEGDAVFAYQSGKKFSRREIILEIIESCYYSFRDIKNTFNRIRTCKCKACQMASSLDLKFITHYGDYVLGNVAGKIKPLGTSVNVAHRLLKNSISDTTGWKAYALFTKECIDVIGLNGFEVHAQTETFEHIGDIETFSIDLDRKYKNFCTDRKVYLSRDDADLVIEKDFPIPPTMLWEWLNDPKKRSLWEEGSDWNSGERPEGRTGKGATNHCANSKILEKILDYKPFNYYTSTIGRGLFSSTMTSNLEELRSGTRLSVHLKINSFLPKWISKSICKIIFEKILKINHGIEKLFQLVEEEKLNNKITV